MRRSGSVLVLMCLCIFLLGTGVVHGQSAASIVGWGSQVVVEQAALNNLVAVAAGATHSLGLRSEGTIVAWGLNEDGQCNVPVPNADFVAVAGGGYHSLGLKSDGTIIAWGNNSYGQCEEPALNADFVAVAVTLPVGKKPTDVRSGPKYGWFLLLSFGASRFISKRVTP